ncbi:hypothetical protein F5I97DRAFT_35195 [Phlebopus sp. FC_14]|nr:hypothetical protein F5I97DRAFT_35195 [Phlebopus sp. FC_14]
MLVVHPASLCDVCLDPYNISSEPANSPHAIACGHIFCLTCLRNLSPSACPLCRKAFQPDRVKKLHVAGPPELDGAEEEGEGGATTTTNTTQAFLLLQRLALVSGEDIPDEEVVEVVTEVDAWLSGQSENDDSTRPVRAAVNTLQRYKALQDQHEREKAEHRRLRHQFKHSRRHADHDSKTSRAVEESLLTRIQEIESDHAFELSRLHAEIESLRDTHSRSRNTSNPLPAPPEPLPFDQFPAFARPGGSADDIFLGAIPYPGPPPRAQPGPTLPDSSATMTNGNAGAMNGHTTAAPIYAGTSNMQYVPVPPVPQQSAAPRPRHAEAPRQDERSRRRSMQDDTSSSYTYQDRGLRAESVHSKFPDAAAESRHKANEVPRERVHIVPGAPPSQRVVPSLSSPSWAYRPLVEERRSSDEESEVSYRARANGSVNSRSDRDSFPSVEARLASAAAYIQGYGSGYGSGYLIASEPVAYAPSYYGSERSSSSERGHGFPGREPPDEAVGGLGLMGVPQQMGIGTVSAPDQDATPMNRSRRLGRRSASQTVDPDRSARVLGDATALDVPPSGANRRAPGRNIDVGFHDTGARGGVTGADNTVRGRPRIVTGVAAPLAGETESPRSETTWGTVLTVPRSSVSGGSMGDLGLLLGLHNGGVRGQGSVAGDSFVGGGVLNGNTTSEEGDDVGTDDAVTPVMPGGLGATTTDGSMLGLIGEDDRDYSRGRLETRTLQRAASYTTSISHPSEATQTRHARHARRSERTSEHRRHVSQPTSAESFPSSSGRNRTAESVDMTNALSLHFDASLSTHDQPLHTFSGPSSTAYPNSGYGPEIIAPTPIVGGPNVIHLWANRA